MQVHVMLSLAFFPISPSVSLTFSAVFVVCFLDDFWSSLSLSTTTTSCLLRLQCVFSSRRLSHEKIHKPCEDHVLSWEELKMSSRFLLGMSEQSDTTDAASVAAYQAHSAGLKTYVIDHSKQPSCSNSV